MNDSLRAKDQPAGETSRRPSSGVLPMLTVLVVGMVMGAAASAGLLFGAIDAAAPWVDTGVHVLVPVLGAFGAALALVVPLALAVGCRGQLGEELRRCRDAEPEPLQGGLIDEQAVLERLARQAS